MTTRSNLVKFPSNEWHELDRKLDSFARTMNTYYKLSDLHNDLKKLDRNLSLIFQPKKYVQMRHEIINRYVVEIMDMQQH